VRWVAGGIAVAALATLVLIAVNDGSTPSRMPSTTQIAGRLAPTVAPPGTRPVTFHGLTVFVPSSWATDAVKCGAPLRDTVFFEDGAQPACGSIGTSAFSEAVFRFWGPGDASDVPSRRSLTIDTHPATVHAEVRDGVHVTELVVPDLSAMVTITTTDPKLGERIVLAAQITRTDANGCASTMPYVDLTSPPTAGPADVMVAGNPGTVAICTYERTYLERGVTLAGADGARLVDLLNALPTGLSEASPKDYLPTLCRRPGHASSDDMDSENYSIRFSYPHGPTAVVYARLSLCGALGFTNGTRTGQRTTPVTDLLVSLSGFNALVQGDIHPR
jgi:hypothetical protein